MNKWKRIVSLLMVLVLIGISGNGLTEIKVNAADSTVKIFIGDSKTPRHHKAIAVGSETEELSFSLKDGTIKSSSYASNNPASFKIKNTTEGKCIVEGVAEGTGLVTLTVKTEEGNTYKEKLFISVYTRIGSYSGVANKNTDVYRGATDNAGVENKDDKGDIKKNTKFSVNATCGKFYIIKTLDGTVYEDNQDTGFVKKADIDIMADSLKINEEGTSIKVNGSIKLSTTIAPEIAVNKKANWTSSNTKTAVVDENGQVSGKSEGTVIVTATAKDGSVKKDSVYVSVYSSMSDTAGYLNTDSVLYLVANDKLARGNGSRGETLMIVGQCGSYYRVRMDKSQNNTDGYLYVPKNNVQVPVESVKFDRDKISLLTNQSIQLKINIGPINASNKSVEYTSDNTSVVKVDSKGIITTYKEGIANVTVTTEDGKHMDSCVVYVSGNKSVVWADSKVNSGKKKTKTKGKLKAKGKDDESILITWDAYKSVKRYELQRTAKNSNKYKTIKKLDKKKKQFVDKKVKFYTKYKYRLLIINNKGKKSYSNIVTARTKDSKVNIVLKAEGNTINSIKLSWNKQKHVEKYEILKKGKNGKYKTIKTLSNKSKSYIDKNVKYYTKCYYRIKVIKTNKKNKNSNIAWGRTKYKLDKTKNLQFFRKNYPFVCTDNTKNINNYFVYDNYYAPVKYQFDGETLKIHIYIEYAKYIGNKESGYTKTSASRTDGKGGVPFVELYKQGVKENFEVDIAENKYEFQGINFSVKVVFHEKGKEKYNKNQYFNEILLGGECPNCSSIGDHWYHQQGVIDWSEEKQTYVTCFSRIYLPYDYQLKDNIDMGAQIPRGKKAYLYMVAHETGHLLGLDDAYSIVEFNNVINKYQRYDRFTDNSETGVKCRDGDYKNMYDNLMAEVEDDKPIIANDVEMMLYAYQQGKGRPTDAYQSYRTVKDLNMLISSVISNKNDLYVEDAIWK